MPERRQFGDYSLDGAAGELRKGDLAIKLAPQPMRVLALLASRQGEVVSRDEICREIWGDSVHVDFETGLNSCIKQVRHALGDTKLVETVPKRGYRLRVPESAAVRQEKPRGLAWFMVPALAAVVAILMLEVFMHTP